MTWIDERIGIDLPAAIDRGELYVLFQPQLDLATGVIVAAEALCRWQHPELGLVMPSVFIPVAEQTGVINGIGHFMLDQGMLAAERFRDGGHPLEVAVNVSPVQLAEGDFTDEVLSGLQRHELPPGTLTIEITESLPVLGIPQVELLLDGLRVSGVGVSLDDYGSGHSSPEQLAALPASELKLDKSLVQDGARADIVALVVTAHERGIRVVAEGIETELQLERAREVGCDRAQGFLVGMPMPAEELELLLV